MPGDSRAAPSWALPPDAENEEILARLASATGPERAALEEQVVARNVGLVKSIALRFTYSGEPLDDLIQAGYIGLLNAMANFNLARNTKFSTYASHLVQGEIRHYIRDRHTTIRIPQWVQSMNRRIKEAEEAFFQDAGHPPTLEELARSLDLTPEQLAAVLRGRDAMTYVSIDRERRASDPNPTPPTLEEVLHDRAGDGMPHDLRLRIAAAIERLATLQQEVVHGLFYHGKSQSELGEDLGISQRQVSRIKEKALDELREALFLVSDTVEDRRRTNGASHEA
ncbi:MAG: sigma-70 family RNA polymerase sigma factor [Candidatus Bipolaricaulota bacterium]